MNLPLANDITVAQLLPVLALVLLLAWLYIRRRRKAGRTLESVFNEIAFDVVHASSRHKSGYALRFPRIVRIRDDKPASEVDRLSTVAALHERLQIGGRYGVLTGGTMST